MTDENQQTIRGRFRDVNFSEVQKLANDPMWDREESRLSYAFPVPLKQKIADKGKRLIESPDKIPEDQVGRVGIFYTAASPQTHIGPWKNAIDFLVHDGTPVLAAADGWVDELVESSSTYGDGEEFRDQLNFITICHGSGESTQYCHLAKNSARKAGIKKGDQVKKGQRIGTVGKTGWTDRDHLHFCVFRSPENNRFGFKSLVPKFE